MKLSNVWVVEGVSGNPAATVAAFALEVGPDGWRLSDTEQPSFERQWSWETIGGLEVVRGAGKTPDGRPATARHPAFALDARSRHPRRALQRY